MAICILCGDVLYHIHSFVVRTQNRWEFASEILPYPILPKGWRLIPIAEKSLYHVLAFQFAYIWVRWVFSTVLFTKTDQNSIFVCMTVWRLIPDHISIERFSDSCKPCKLNREDEHLDPMTECTSHIAKSIQAIHPVFMAQANRSFIPLDSMPVHRRLAPQYRWYSFYSWVDWSKRS